MAKFVRSNFHTSGDYLLYEGRFVARFKHSDRDKPGFIRFLIANFTVEEYFKGLETAAPVTVLETKGYISLTVARILQQMGFPPTAEGKAAYIASV